MLSYLRQVNIGRDFNQRIMDSIYNIFLRGPTKFQQKFGKVQDTGMDRVKMDVSEGIWTYPRGKMDVQGIFKGGHFVRDAEVAGSNPVASIPWQGRRKA